MKNIKGFTPGPWENLSKDELIAQVPEMYKEIQRLRGALKSCEEILRNEFPGTDLHIKVQTMLK